jgi:hypothetical protein
MTKFDIKIKWNKMIMDEIKKKIKKMVYIYIKENKNKK